jgi:hypothetical protein
MVQRRKDQDKTWIFVVPNQLSEISSSELITSRRRDITGSIQSRFVYQLASLDYYEPVED